MRNRIFGFPGLIDFLVVVALIISAPKWVDGFLIFPVVAVIRMAIPVFFMKANTSHRGLSYDLIMIALSAVYLFLWGRGDAPSVIMAYMGCAAAAEIILVLVANKRRLFK